MPPEEHSDDAQPGELVDHIDPNAGDERGLVEPTPTHATPAADAPAESPAEDELAADLAAVRAPRKHWLTDTQALAVIAGWFIFRIVLNRAGFGYAMNGPVWLRPLINNRTIVLLAAADDAKGNVGLLVGAAASSVLVTMIAALVLYWAGWRFGEELAERGAEAGSSWSMIWNPRHVARAHRWLEKWGIVAVFLGTATGRLELPIALLSGSARMQLRKFIPAQVVGAVVRVGLTLWLGREASERFSWFRGGTDTLARWGQWIALGSLVLLALAFVLNRFAPKPPSEDAPAPEKQEAD